VLEPEVESDAQRRARSRDRRQEALRQIEEEAAGPPAFRVTLAQARAGWPQWEAAQNERREKGRRTVTEKYGSPVLASFLVDVHVPELPPSTEVVVYALELECGHEEFWLVKRADASKPPPERFRCPIFWKCQLNDGRTAVCYVEPGEPEPEFAGLGLTRWSVDLACGHRGEVLREEAEEYVLGDYAECPTCQSDATDFGVKIVAIGERLPDKMVQNWKVELNCGHVGTDHFIPLDRRDDPAAYRAQHPRQNGLHCIDEACDQREVRGTRRLGLLGRICAPKSTPPSSDPVALAANDLRRRLTKEERQALIRRLQEED
jgi:hypothetical protein